ncbi:unnamed protein product [Withania somnifera]
MEATLFSLPSAHSHHKSHFNNPFTHPHLKPKTLTIRSAISRTKKEATVETVKQQLEDCYLLAGISYKGLTVKQFQELRTQLPETTKLLVAKNTLVLKAIEGTKWEALKPSALKPYRTFQKEKKLEENDFSGGVFEGKFYGADEFKVLENLPTRVEIYAHLLGSLKGPASAVVGTIQAPARNLVMVLKAYVEKLEEEGGSQ